MQTFTCPDCNHTNTFDPWTESAHCTRCGFTPPTGRSQHSYLAAMEKRGHQPLLDELLCHWNGTHAPDPAFTLETPDDALLFFKDYQKLLEGHIVMPAERGLYLRDYDPRHHEILAFSRAYLHLRHGDYAKAIQHFQSLVESCPSFADAWVWLSATTDDPATRQEYLEKAVLLEPTHPLARDALAIIQGKVSPTGRRRERDLKLKTTLTQCSKCGGALRYEPDVAAVACPYCGHLLDIPQSAHEATLISHLQLERRYQGHVWKEVQRIMSCRTCGACLVMTHYLAKSCAFCGSTHVLIEDNWRTFEQPDSVVPFIVSEHQAASAIHKALQKLPRVTNLQGVYLPFWVFDGVVEIRWRDKQHSHSTPPQLAKLDHKWYTDLLFPGAGVPPLSFLERVYPFDLSAMRSYEPQLLADWPAQLYSLDVEGVAEEARNAIVALARREASPPAVQPDRSHTPLTFRSTFQVSTLTYQLVLLPLWIAPTLYRDERCLVLVNGQTGKVDLCS